MKNANQNYTAGSMGFDSSGQLFAEENDTLGVIVDAVVLGGAVVPEEEPTR